MAIKGLTDQRAKLPTVGIIRKGGPKIKKVKDGREYEVVGPDLDHFRFDTEDGEAKAMFEAAYGPTPRVIRVALLYDSIVENFDAWKEHWIASSLQHRCDGERTVIWQENGVYHTKPEEQIDCPGKCKQVGRLTVVLPDLKRFAAVTVLTTSKHDIMELQGNLESIKLQGGKLALTTFLLKRVEREISTPVTDTKGNPTGKRARRSKWLLSIEPEPKWLDLRLSAAENAERALANPAPQLQLGPAPVEMELDEDDESFVMPDSPIVTEEREDGGVILASDNSLDTLRDTCDLLSDLGVTEEQILARVHRLTNKKLTGLDKGELATLTAAELAKVQSSLTKGLEEKQASIPTKAA